MRVEVVVAAVVAVVTAIAESLNTTFPGYNTSSVNVHLVPHSHCDVGWLKTVDQYFEGTNNSIQHANVRKILDTVVRELQLDASRRFIWVEQVCLRL